MRDWIAVVHAHLGGLAVDPARERDIVEELAQHVADEHAELVAGGMDDDEALRRVLAPLHERARVAAAIARADRPRPSAPLATASAGFLSRWMDDLRYGARTIARSPGFAIAVVLTLAIGMGANTAIFSVINAVLLRPLPYAHADRLVTIGERGSDRSVSNVGYATFVDWKEQTHSFEQMVLIRSWAATLVTDGVAENVQGLRVSSDYFRMLGVTPAIGRDFRASDDTPSSWRVMLISDRLWRTRFHADPSIAGRTIVMNDKPFEIIGVLPASYEPLISQALYQQADMWAALGYDVTLPFACRDCQHLKALGVVKAGTTLEAARADIDAVQARLRATFPDHYSRDGAMILMPIMDVLTGGVRPALVVLMAAVALVLLIACANVASLLLARVSRRERDLRLRIALGASRGRLIRQQLIESLILSLAGCALGVTFCAWSTSVLFRLTPVPIVRMTDAGLDARVLLFAGAVSVLATLLTGLIPALRASRINLAGAGHADARRTSRAPVSTGRRLLIAADVALAVALLAGAGLLIRSVSRLLEVDPGFSADGVLTADTSFGGAAYAKDEQVVAVTNAMLEKLRAVPGVQLAAAAGQIPLGGNGDRWGFHIQSRPATRESDDPSVERYSVTPDYFGVMKIPLERGRLFTESDIATAEPVMLIGDTTARRLWPQGDPIDEHIRVGDPLHGPWYRIVGVVGDVRHQQLASPPTMQFYTPEAQLTDSNLIFVVRTHGDPAAIATDMRRVMHGVEPNAPIKSIAPMSDLVLKSAGSRRFVMLLLSLFSAIALLLTAIGVYGVIAGSVAERTREIGIRVALGASPLRIATLVLGAGMTIVFAGLGAGVALALSTTNYLKDSLYDVSAHDGATFASVVVVLAAVAALAHAVPVARALRIAPTVALKQD